MNSSSPAAVLVGLGVLFILAGVLYWLGWLSWFGHLPGDIRIEKETTRVYFPVVSMIVVSVAVSLLLWLIGKIRR